MSDIKQLLKQYEEVNKELNIQIKENGEVFINTLFQEIFDQHEGLNVVAIVGYTPGFNDGDPCTNSSYIYTGHDNDFVDELGSFEESFEYDEETEEHLNSKCTTLDQVWSQVSAYEEIIERIYDTNFQIVVSRSEDGNVVVCVDEYYCGYQCMILNPKGSLKTDLAVFDTEDYSALPLEHIKYMRWDRAYNIVPNIVKPVLECMFDLMPENKDMQWVVDYKVVDLKKGDCGVKLEGWHLDCVPNPWHKSLPETHLLFSTHFGTEFLVDEMLVRPNDNHFSKVLEECGGWFEFNNIQVRPNTITQYSRFNLHRAPIVQTDCRRMTLRLTQTEVINRR